MEIKLNKHSYLRINGYTINPIKDHLILRDLVMGLVGYKSFHKCDYGITDIIHKNYLGKIVGVPNIQYIDYEGYKGLNATVFLTNGYFVIKILDSLYPAEIQLDLYIRGELGDADLIIDHLAAPGLAHDGMGMFDYTYKITSEIIPQHSMSSSKINTIDDLKQKDTLDDLNTLKNSRCYFCEETASAWVFIGPNEKQHTRSVLVCNGHKSFGRSGEHVDPYLVGKPASDIIDLFDRKNVHDEDGNFLYTVNERIQP
jgi:hypothetical protein